MEWLFKWLAVILIATRNLRLRRLAEILAEQQGVGLVAGIRDELQ